VGFHLHQVNMSSAGCQELHVAGARDLSLLQQYTRTAPFLCRDPRAATTLFWSGGKEQRSVTWPGLIAIQLGSHAASREGGWRAVQTLGTIAASQAPDCPGLHCSLKFCPPVPVQPLGTGAARGYLLNRASKRFHPEMGTRAGAGGCRAVVGSRASTAV
jgi:hypothetical protein